MTRTHAQPPPTQRPAHTTPPLENGDRLTRAEFERRWKAMPDLKRAELIDGVVYMAAAVRLTQHGSPHLLLATWLGYYISLTPGLIGGDNTSVGIDTDNMPQPDLLLRIPEQAGGQSAVDEDGYIDGAPELVAEVAASSASLDLHAKLDVYRRAGVREYIVWRVLDEQVDWFVNREGTFERLVPDGEGVIGSTAFPGLSLDTAALLEGNLSRLIERLNTATKTDEHQAFVKQLQGASESP